MPSCLSAPVLSLDAGKMHEIDPANACSLMAMWSIFAKCSESLKDGPRLENMSWRVWSRESLCVAPVDSPLESSSRVPSLSNSYSSDNSVDEKGSSRRNSRSRSIGHHDSARSLSKSRHLTPHTLEKIVVTIQEKTELCPLSPSIEASLPALPTLSQPQPQPVPNSEPTAENEPKSLRDSTDSCMSNTTAATTSPARQSEHRNSDTSVSSADLVRTQSIVHGFSPVTSSFRKTTNVVQPTPPTSNLIPKGKTSIKPAMFTLGGSSEDDESSFEQRVLTHRPAPQKSSLSQSLSKSNLVNGSAEKQKLQPKRTSFRDIIAARRIQEDAENDEGAIASSDEEDEDDDEEEEDTDEAIESAIDEDEDGDEWEDSNSDDGRTTQEPNLFRRVESRPDLVSRRSMLTLALHKGQGGLNYAYSQPVLRRPGPTSPQGKSAAGSPEEEEGMMMQTSKRPPIAIPPPKASTKAVAHSPRTTRRNMLATELTESLRKNLLWERQQKSQTANAFLKRSRNAQSMANLQRHATSTAGPFQPPAPQETSKNNSWNHYFDNPWEYHAKGW